MIDTPDPDKQFQIGAEPSTYGNSEKTYVGPVLIEETDLVVTYTNALEQETILTRNVHYTVDLYGTDRNDSQITLLQDGELVLKGSGWTSTDIISLTRNIPIEQPIDYVDLNNFPAQNHEIGLDRLTLLVAQIASGISPTLGAGDRALKYPLTEDPNTDNVLPKKSDRIGKIFSFNVDGEPDVTDISSDSIGGMTGPSVQTEGTLAIFDQVKGTLRQNTDIAESLWLQQDLVAFYGQGNVDWDADLGHFARISMVDDFTVSISNAKVGRYALLVTQDSVGGRALTFGSNFKDREFISINSTPDGVTALNFIYDGTQFHNYTDYTTSTGGDGNTQETTPSGGAVTVDLSLGRTAIIDLDQNAAITLDNLSAGTFKLYVRQDSTGGRTPTFPANVYGLNTNDIDLTADAVTELRFYTDGTDVVAHALDDLPVGTVIDLPSATQPTGYWLMDGSALPGTTPATLFARYAAAGFGTSTFPDRQDRVPRMTGGPNAPALLVNQDEATAVNGLSVAISTDGAHTHSFSASVYREDVETVDTAGADTVYGDENQGTPTGELTIQSDGSHTHTATPSGDVETRMDNQGTNFWIKI